VGIWPCLPYRVPGKLKAIGESLYVTMGALLQAVACMGMDKCTHCGNDIPLSEDRCPHCALPGLFPNVRAGEAPAEVQSLEDRYRKALDRANLAGCGAVAQRFEQAMQQTRAVVNRPIGEVQRLATSDNELYATYYQLTNSGVKIPQGDVWDKRRAATDDVLFPGWKEKVRFAALTGNEEGVWHYGQCAVILKDTMIAHRASVFEENSVVFMRRHDIKVYSPDALPKGFRASWAQRHKVCLAKLAGQLDVRTPDSGFASILLKQGATPEDDAFVEVHIWGPLTRRGFERVVVQKTNLRRAGKVLLHQLKEQLRSINVPVEM
jgi:hypothetical protein